MNWVIYKIVSPVGKVYIGKTIDFNRRINKYKTGCDSGQRLLFRSLNKYGFDNHEISIIEENLNSNELSTTMERYWIEKYKTNQSKWRNGIGLNLTDGGEGTLGLKPKKRTAKMNNLQRDLKCKLYGNAVVQYDFNGTIIKEFPAKRVAAKELGISRTTLKNILNNKTAYTYLPYILLMKGQPFRIVKNAIRGTKVNAHVSNSQTLIDKYGKSILQYSTGGDFIQEFKSITVAAKGTGLIRQNIRANLMGRSKRVHNFVFKYKEVT